MSPRERQIARELYSYDFSAVKRDHMFSSSALGPMTNHYPDHCDICGTELRPGDGRLIALPGHNMKVVCRDN